VNSRTDQQLLRDYAAQKRVSRAVERLRECFAQRGIRVGASGLVVVISAHGVQAAPVGLVANISTAAALVGTAIQTSTAFATTQAIAMTTLQNRTSYSPPAEVVAQIAALLSERKPMDKARMESWAKLIAQIPPDQMDQALLAALQLPDPEVRTGVTQTLLERGGLGFVRQRLEWPGAHSGQDRTGPRVLPRATQAREVEKHA
jgi:hypothetical protein